MKLRSMVAPVVFGAFGLAAGAYAAPADNNATDGGRIITNNATLDYKVNGQAQTSVDAFENVLVDVKVDFDLSRVNASLNPSTTLFDLDNTPSVDDDNYYLVGVIDLANTGNAPTFFSLAAINTSTGTDLDGTTSSGPTDTKDVATGFDIFVESSASPDGLSSVDSKNPASVEVAKDATKRIYIVAKQDRVAGVDGDVFGTQLTVEATDVTRQVASIAANNVITYTTSKVAVPASSNDSVGDLAFVFADTGNNAEEIIVDGMVASFPDLNNGGNAGDGNGNFTKTATVISDPFNGVSSDAKAIPGAVVEYVIKVSNTGSSNATDVIVRDTVPAETTLDTASVKVLVPDSSDPTKPGTTAVTGADSSSTTATEVVVNLGTLNGGANAADKETNFIVYRVEIK